jgi:hypothetical protein
LQQLRRLGHCEGLGGTSVQRQFRRGIYGGSVISLVLYGHPFSSFTKEVLIALYENAAAFDFRQLDPDQTEHEARYFRPYFPLSAQDRD